MKNMWIKDQKVMKILQSQIEHKVRDTNFGANVIPLEGSEDKKTN